MLEELRRKKKLVPNFSQNAARAGICDILKSTNMKISKHVHSCLLIEENNTTILIDPCNYTYEEKALDINSLGKLDYLLIAHEHQDHLHIPFIKEIMRRQADPAKRGKP